MGAILWRVVAPVSPKLHARLQWARGRREGLLELRLVDALVGPGDVVADVGANFGLFARRMATLVGRDGRVHIFEPHPGHRDVLRSMAADGPVNFHAVALSDAPGVARLRVPVLNRSPLDSMATLEQDLPAPEGFDPDFEVLEVRRNTLDDALADEPRRLAFVKCDVEGHELAVLRGATDRLRRDHPGLLIEIEQRHQQRDIAATFSFLDEMGYDGWVVRPDGLAPLATFDVERDQSAILRALPVAAPVGPEYLNTFLFLARNQPAPPVVRELRAPGVSCRTP